MGENMSFGDAHFPIHLPMQGQHPPIWPTNVSGPGSPTASDYFALPSELATRSSPGGGPSDGPNGRSGPASPGGLASFPSPSRSGAVSSASASASDVSASGPGRPGGPAGRERIHYPPTSAPSSPKTPMLARRARGRACGRPRGSRAQSGRSARRASSVPRRSSSLIQPPVVGTGVDEMQGDAFDHSPFLLTTTHGEAQGQGQSQTQGQSLSRDQLRGQTHPPIGQNHTQGHTDFPPRGHSQAFSPGPTKQQQRSIQDPHPGLRHPARHTGSSPSASPSQSQNHGFAAGPEPVISSPVTGEPHKNSGLVRVPSRRASVGTREGLYGTAGGPIGMSRGVGTIHSPASLVDAFRNLHQLAPSQGHRD